VGARQFSHTLFRVPTGQGKLKKVREFNLRDQGKVRENIIFEKSGKFANLRLLLNV